MEEHKEIKIKFSPDFLASVDRITSKMTDEQKESFLESLNETIEQIKLDPYSGKPVPPETLERLEKNNEKKSDN